MQRIFPTRFLIALLAVSLLTNAILIVKPRFRRAWLQVQLAFVPAPTAAPSDHVRGNPTARVTIIEYADFQCPFCSEFHSSMQKLVEETDTRWIYRHFPITAIHPLAHRSAEAAECAAEQGRFWSYADLLFERQDEIGDDLFFQIAETLGLDGATFEECLGSARYKDRIVAHAEEASAKRISGTPTFYINDRRVNGVVPYDSLRMMVVESGGP